jgi:hypothetical protein
LDDKTELIPEVLTFRLLYNSSVIVCIADNTVRLNVLCNVKRTLLIAHIYIILPMPEQYTCTS